MNLIFKAIMSVLWAELFKPFLRLAVSKLGGVLWESAKYAVKYVNDNASTIPRDDRLNAALDIMKNQVEQKGKTVSTSLGHTFIELALQVYKKRWS